MLALPVTECCYTLTYNHGKVQNAYKQSSLFWTVVVHTFWRPTFFAIAHIWMFLPLNHFVANKYMWYYSQGLFFPQGCCSKHIGTACFTSCFTLAASLSAFCALSCCLWKERYFALLQHVDFSFSVIHLLLYNNGYSTSFKNRPPYSVAPHWTQRENISTGLKEQARKCQFSSLPHCITHDLPTYPKRPFCSPAFLGHLLRF